MNKVLFDDIEAKLYSNDITLSELNINIIPNKLISDSSLITDPNDKIIKSTEKMPFKLTWVNFGFYRGVLGMPVYLYNCLNKKILFEFGEYQPGRYILNQLAVIEAEEKK